MASTTPQRSPLPHPEERTLLPHPEEGAPSRPSRRTHQDRHRSPPPQTQEQTPRAPRRPEDVRDSGEV